MHKIKFTTFQLSFAYTVYVNVCRLTRWLFCFKYCIRNEVLKSYLFFKIKSIKYTAFKGNVIKSHVLLYTNYE